MITVKKIVAVAIMGLFAQAANASTIGIYDGAIKQGDLTCGGGCEVLLSEYGNYSTTTGSVFTVHPPNDATELAFVNDNLAAGDTAFASGAGTKDESPSDSFVTDALYIIFKIGGGHSNATFLVHNTSGGDLSLTWDEVAGIGAGLSHTSSFGVTTGTIPLPASGLLLMGALGGLVASRRRKHA